jgi:ribosomal protein S18 acetylase RimI-like enzyme
MIQVRRAIADDAPALAELRWEFRSGREPAVESHDAFIARCVRWMHGQLADQTWAAWVALDDHGSIVGQVWVDLIEKLPNPVGEREHHAYLSNLYVKPDARGGVGAALLEAALEWTRSRDVDSVVLWATPRSVTLYQRYEFSREGGRLMERKT